MVNFTGYEDGVNYIPPHTREALENYIEHGFKPGSFLFAVLCNDLMGAFARADHDNTQCMKGIVHFVFNRMPLGSYGDSKSVYKYIDRKEAERQQEFNLE